MHDGALIFKAGPGRLLRKIELVTGLLACSLISLSALSLPLKLAGFLFFSFLILLDYSRSAFSQPVDVEIRRNGKVRWRQQDSGWDSGQLTARNWLSPTCIVIQARSQKARRWFVILNTQEQNSGFRLLSSWLRLQDSDQVAV